MVECWPVTCQPLSTSHNRLPLKEQLRAKTVARELPTPPGVRIGGPYYIRKCGVFCVDTYLDCDFKPGNGCEVDFSTDEQHCGACDAACNAGKVCVSGVCTTP